MATHHVRNGYHTVTPYFIVSNADKLIEFVVHCFDARIIDIARKEDGKVRHAEIRIGDSIIEISEANAKYLPVQIAIHLYLSNVDEVYSKCLKAGAESIEEPLDHSYGERGAGIRDSHGNQWFIATRTEA